MSKDQVTHLVDVKAHGLDPALKKKKMKTTPRAAHKETVSDSSPVNDLRIVCSSLPPQDVRHPAFNFFIPSTGMMFHLLGTMNDKVCTLRSFAHERGCVNDWIPQVSNIVFSVLFYVQTLRVQQYLTALSPSQNLFLTNFVGMFPLESIEIPGPLVPFFRSISAAAPGFGNFQEVLPRIPSLCCRENRLFSLDFTPPDALAPFDGIAMMLPHIPLMMDQFIHLIKYLLSDTADQPRK